MKILQVIPVFSDPFGGPVTVVRSISKELAKRHEVVVYTTTALDFKHDSNPREEEVDGYRVTYFPRILKPLCYSGLLGQLNLSSSMMNAVRENLKNFDIVHLHSWQQFPDIIVHRYASMYGVPYVLQVHGSIPRIGKRLRKLFYDISYGYRVLRDASKVVALSKIELEQYRSMGVPDEKMVIIPNGIDLSEYDNLPSKGSFKKRFNISGHKKIILYLGRIHEIKGIDFLVKAYACLISRRLGDAILVIAGPDDGYLHHLWALIKALRIENKVLITGPLYGKDRLKAYVDASVYVLSSRYETFPMGVLEAIACGTPVILTEECGVAGYFKDKCGLVVKLDSNHLCEALHEMLSNQERRAIFVGNCRAMAQRFDISKTVSRLEEIYTEICA